MELLMLNGSIMPKMSDEEMDILYIKYYLSGDFLIMTFHAFCCLEASQDESLKAERYDAEAEKHHAVINELKLKKYFRSRRN